MGLIMPLYTIGIVAFFVYTIMKVSTILRSEESEQHLKSYNPFQLVMKKPDSQSHYPNPTKPDPTFKEQVFHRGNNKVGNLGKIYWIP